MKTFPYNRASAEGKRLYQLLDMNHNSGRLDAVERGELFTEYTAPTVMLCRVNDVSFIIPSNLSGIKRPQVVVRSDIERAWGTFTEDISELDFSHSDQELPLTYVQPIEDDTMHHLINAGLYRDDRFEELISKLMADEVFDAEAELKISHLKTAQDITGEHTHVSDNGVDIMLVDPVNVIHEHHDSSEQTTLADLLKRSALLAIELDKENVNRDQIIGQRDASADLDSEVFISDRFTDVVTEREEEDIMESVRDEYARGTAVQDVEVDVTDDLAGEMSYDDTSEDDKIRSLKERDDIDLDNVTLPDAALEQEYDYGDGQDTDSDTMDLFGDDIDDIDEDELEDDGPSI